MSSTNKTTNLGLNNWVASDKPKRIDFVSDNNIIDSVLGGHINNGDIHLTSAEKQRVGEPFKVIDVYGTGEPETGIHIGFAPKLVVFFKKNTPAVELTNGYSKTNAAVATTSGTTGGVTISGETIVTKQSTAAEGSVFFNLNEKYAQYIAVAFR